MQWMTVFKTESIGAWRNYKLIWVPLVFILLGIMDPLSTYYLPQILESVGGLPEGATIEIPTPPPADVFMMSIGQFNMIGIAVLVLMSMGTIANERKSGIAELILVKPVRYGTYVTAKWASIVVLSLLSMMAGILGSWYYVNLLFGELSFELIGAAAGFYGLWIIFVITVTIFMNTLVKTPGLAAFLSIATLVAMFILSMILAHIIEWNPSLLTSYLGDMLQTGSIPDNLWGTAVVTILLITALLISASYILKHKELA
ncbi:ABC transporter permease [Halobacillus naozhouensis]|uniref:ABC-2 transporter permease n=1 Tax=Halobacillus naozhouensis TaxID=554880 RepID=A0ABY8J029_9BACI|nr:ABC-2 transporter permease [Halobacillus naozhouensis]WFT75853.1 ABC-2 transporter permease [Halobacillus naozhouensis]